MDRRKTVTLIILCLILILCGCGKTEPAAEQTVIDVNDFNGMRVGVNLAWEADYLLTGRKDIKLYRYDSLADMLMALKSHKLDAFALDHVTLAVITSQISGVEKVEPPLGKPAYVAYFNANEQELMDDFNAFLSDWKASEEYSEFIRSQDEFDGVNYQGTYYPEAEDGKSIVVAYIMEGFPRSFYNTVTDEPDGFDVQVIRRWAYERGYKIDFVGTAYEDMEMGTLTGRYQVGTGYNSTLYKDDAVAAGILVSDPYGDVSIYLCHMTGDSIDMEGYEFE